MRPENQIRTRSSPLLLPRNTIFTSEELVGRIRDLYSININQILKEIVGEGTKFSSQDTISKFIVISVETTHAANEDSHFWSSESQLLRFVHEEFFCTG